MAVRANQSRARAAILIALGASDDEAAQQTNVNERTIRKWREEPEFSAQVNAVRARAWGSAAGVGCGTAARAMKRLGEIAEDRGLPAAVQANACKAVVELALRLSEHIDLQARTAALEEKLAALQAERIIQSGPVVLPPREGEEAPPHVGFYPQLEGPAQINPRRPVYDEERGEWVEPEEDGAPYIGGEAPPPESGSPRDPVRDGDREDSDPGPAP